MAREQTEEEVGYEAVLSPDDPHDCELIEKVASIVAWDQKGELFLMQIMHGLEDFGFLNPGNPHHAYYRHRVAALRRRPCLLYSAW